MTLISKTTRMYVREPLVAGWKEWVGLPDLGVDWMLAKLDTGAKSSSLNAYGIETFERDGAQWTRFELHPWQNSDRDAVRVELPLVDRRVVRSSTGHEEQRLVVETTLRLGSLHLPVEFTLANRDAMGLRMLIGRRALGNGVVVSSSRRYVLGRPPKQIRIVNRSRSD